MRRTIVVGVVAWLAALLVAAVVATGGLRLAGEEVVPDRPAPLSGAEVRERLRQHEGRGDPTPPDPATSDPGPGRSGPDSATSEPGPGRAGPDPATSEPGPGPSGPDPARSTPYGRPAPSRAGPVDSGPAQEGLGAGAGTTSTTP
jgi:hypothetical protein